MTENRRPQTVTDGGQKALPKAISDAIDEHEDRVREDGSGRCSIESRAALERAIAEHVAEQASSKDGAYRERRAGRVARVRQGA